MDAKRGRGTVSVEGKALSKLDLFVLEFTRVLEAQVRYVIVSGYVAIFFGRSRGTEDVDVLIDRLDFEVFLKLYGAIREKGYEFLNPEDERGLFEMLEEGLAIRAAREDRVIPNFEVKFVKDDFDRYALEKRLEVIIGGDQIYISPIELQIPYKLWLGRDKDIEDAVFLWELMKDDLDRRLMREFMDELKVDGGKYGIEL